MPTPAATPLILTNAAMTVSMIVGHVLLRPPTSIFASSVTHRAGDPCGDPDAGSCFQEHATPGCNDETCCTLICGLDPFCCDTQWDFFCVEFAIQLCVGCQGPACEVPSIECVNPSPQYDARTPVAQLLLAGAPFGTGILVAAPGFVIVSSDLVTTTDNPEYVSVRFNVECDQCEGGALKETTTYDELTILHTDTTLRMTILQLDGDPAALFGVASVDDRVPTEFQSVYEIHHAAGRSKGISSGFVTGINDPGQCDQGVATDFGVSAIAAGGAWGAPVFDSDTNAVIGMYYCGPDCAAGAAVPMSAMWPSALSVILSAGGIPNEFCPADIENDGIVNVTDLLQLLAAWGTCHPPCPPTCRSDVNRDCSVNVTDLLALLGSWGPCQ